MDRDVRQQLYLSLLLLGAEPECSPTSQTGTRRSGSELESARERIRQYEEACAALRQAA